MDCGLPVRIGSLHSVSLSLYCLKRIKNPCYLLVVLNAIFFRSQWNITNILTDWLQVIFSSKSVLTVFESFFKLCLVMLSYALRSNHYHGSFDT